MADTPTRPVPVAARWIRPGDRVGTDGAYLPVGRDDVTATVEVVEATDPDDRGLIYLALAGDGAEAVHPKVWKVDVLWLMVPDREVMA